MTARTAGLGALALAAFGLLAFVPRLGNAYYLALAISLLQYTVLATAWGMFSGPAFFGSAPIPSPCSARCCRGRWCC
jgi:branched-chain amino acid transport system permease protein